MFAEVSADAPGRVNIIGEHTDYSGGFVLPIAIAARARVTLVRRADVRVVATSANQGGQPSFRLGDEAPAGDWGDYVRGVTVALREARFSLGGFEARVASEIPVGAGLASSAALCVALLRAIRAAFALPIDDLALVHLAQRAEHAIPGAPVGIMDPMAACFAGEREALFLDTRALTWEKVPLPDGVELLVLDSGERHENAGAGYRARRAECERAAELLGVKMLRDARLEDAARLPAPLDRRVRHVVTENARVEAAVRALKARDVEGLGALLDASHASLRDDFEVSTPRIDRLVAATRAERSVVGARITGGGFGGSIVAMRKR